MNLSASLPPERWARLLGLATLAGVECGLLGPFGSYLANPFTRLVYWTALFWVGALLLVPAVSAGIVQGSRRGFPPLFCGIAAAMLACVPLSSLATLGCYCFWPVHASGIRIAEWYGSTVLVALPCVLGWLWLERHGGARSFAPLSSPSGETPSAAMTLSTSWTPLDEPAAAIPEPVLKLAQCLEMEDHHVRVHLPHGSALYLASMRDAIAAVGNERGLQVHRSWWVARQAVRSWEQDGRSLVLILESGLRVPVARQRVAQLRASHWLDESEPGTSPSA